VRDSDRGEPYYGCERRDSTARTDHQQRASVGLVPRESAKRSVQVELITLAHLPGEYARHAATRDVANGDLDLRRRWPRGRRDRIRLLEDPGYYVDSHAHQVILPGYEVRRLCKLSRSVVASEPSGRTPSTVATSHSRPRSGASHR
jgi:hypothetical protein